MLVSIELDPASQAAVNRMRNFRTLLVQIIDGATRATIRSGRNKLVNLLFAKMGVRWKTILQSRVKYKIIGPGHAELTVTDKPMQATSFTGNWGGGSYTINVLKNGMKVVVPNAFIGRDVKGRWAVFTRDVAAASREQMVGHHKGNIGRKRKPTHKVKPILMSEVLDKAPEIITAETAFLNRAFNKSVQRGMSRVLGVKE